MTLISPLLTTSEHDPTNGHGTVQRLTLGVMSTSPTTRASMPRNEAIGLSAIGLGGAGPTPPWVCGSGCVGGRKFSTVFSMSQRCPALNRRTFGKHGGG